eukprot:SAG25_NODE_315_length_9978_cov_10.651483_1_plen_60_part_00
MQVYQQIHRVVETDGLLHSLWSKTVGEIWVREREREREAERQRGREGGRERGRGREHMI